MKGETGITIAGPYRYGARRRYLPSRSPHRYLPNSSTAPYRCTWSPTTDEPSPCCGASRQDHTSTHMLYHCWSCAPVHTQSSTVTGATSSRGIHHRYGLQVTGNSSSSLPVTWGTRMGDSVMNLYRRQLHILMPVPPINIQSSLGCFTSYRHACLANRQKKLQIGASVFG